VTRRDPRLAIAVFFAVAGAVLLLLVAIARFPTIFSTGSEYRTVFRSVPGLTAGDEVRYGGMLVGSVEDMEIDSADPTRIVVSFRVRGDTPVRSDTRATITQVGLLGEPYLNLEPGTARGEPLPEGSFVPSEESLTFQEAVSRLAAFFDRADTLLTGIERVADNDPWGRIDRTLARVERLIDSTSSGATRVVAQAEIASRRLGELIERTDRLVASMDTTFRGAESGIGETQQELVTTLRETRMLLASVREGLDAGGGVDRLVRNLTSASDNIARLSARLERDPTSLLKPRERPAKRVGPSLRE
jgi:phospholipid/cholesterol/gamma-HCH transport system substrate-binding protein